MKYRTIEAVFFILLISSGIILMLIYLRDDLTTDSLPPLKGWKKTFGGVYSDEGYFVQQTSEGGYIITGETWSFGAGEYDVLLIKTNSTGEMMWNKTFGKTDNDVGLSVRQTTPAGYIITGYTESFGVGNWDVWLIKTNDNGDMMWNTTFGGVDEDLGMFIQQTNDGGYIITGHTKSFGVGDFDVWLIKTDSNGNEIWNKTYGGIKQDLARSVEQTTDGGYIIAGYTQSFGAGEWDVWLIKTDDYGNMVWAKTFGGKKTDWGWSVQQTTDGGFIITAGTDSFGTGSSDVWLIKTTSNGDKVWDKTFGGTENDRGNFVQQTSDGGYVIVGYTQLSNNGDNDVWLIKTDNLGRKLWDRTFEGPNSETGRSIQQTIDGGYIIVGYTSLASNGDNDVLLIKVNS